MPLRTTPRMRSKAHCGPYRGSVSLAAAAAAWGVPRREVRRLAASGCLPFVEVAGRVRLPQRLASMSWEQAQRCIARRLANGL